MVQAVEGQDPLHPRHPALPSRSDSDGQAKPSRDGGGDGALPRVGSISGVGGSYVSRMGLARGCWQWSGPAQAQGGGGGASPLSFDCLLPPRP
jgi:hypothetical protein